MKKTRTILVATMLLFSTGQSVARISVINNLPRAELKPFKIGAWAYWRHTVVQKNNISEGREPAIDQVEIKEGSGSFVIEGGKGKNDKTIKVFYHKPKNFKADSRVLLVIPGDGRNGDSYRDAWVEESEKYSVLILSPMYAENDYPFEDYHMCGLMSDLNLESSIKRIEGSNVVELDENKFRYKVNHNSDEWIFNDFDRIFDLAVKATNSKQTKYDVFGHSAGGQILHRFALFHPDSKADRILASNSGFYTVPDFNTDLPFGIKNTSLTSDKLRASFRKNLILFIGELDNQNETGGTLLRSRTVDKQGLDRLERASFFYNQAKTLAEKQHFDFNWQLKIIPGVGHNHRKIGDEAAKLLYGQE